MYSTLRLTTHGTTLSVRFHGLDADLLNGDVFTDLDRLGATLARDSSVRAVIITGPRPGIFAPHYDLAEILAGAQELGLRTPYPLARMVLGAVAGAIRVPGAEAGLRQTPLAGVVALLATHRALARLQRLPQVVIAAISGDALGGGCEVALACDIRVMADGPFLIGLPEISAGIPPGAGGSVRMVRTIGGARAAAMMLRARPLSPQDAQAVGLVDDVVAPDELLAAATRIADRVAEWNPAAVLAAKRAMAAASGSERAFRVEAAGFIATASAAPAQKRLAEFGRSARDASPWRDRSWLDL